ncbi:MAG: RHS repeat-associated core domain-containing protein [Bryobacteraceae bacterium]
MAAQGKHSVGHPVDVAAGTLTTESRDILIPCRIELYWTRKYSSERAIRPSQMGLGWTTEYDAQLRKDIDGFTFTFPSGGEVEFDDPGQSLERGAILISLGAFVELFKRGDVYVASEWSISSTVITRYVFRPAARTGEFRLERIEDITGQGTTLLYSENGLLSRVVEDRGHRTLIFNRSSAGLIDAIDLSVGPRHFQRLATYEYDERWRLTAAFDASGTPIRYAYNENDRLIREVSRDGGVFSFSYDVEGRCTRTSGLDDYDRQDLVYRPAMKETEVTDSIGGTWIYRFRDDGQVTQIVTPLGFTKTYEYDEAGRVITEMEPNGAALRFEFDEVGNLAAITNALGYRDEFFYNVDRRPTLHRDKNGNLSQREYDDRNRMVAHVDPLGNRWGYSYSEQGDLSTIVDPLGNRKSYTYNAYGDMLGRTTFRGHVHRYERDDQGRVVSYLDTLGNQTSIERDPRGYARKVVLPNGTWRLVYDSEGNLLEKIDPGGNRTVSRFGPCRRLYERIYPDGTSIVLHWSSIPAQLLSVTNEKGEVHAFEYDLEGRITREITFDGREMLFDYDEAAWCTAINDAGRVTRLRRDPLGHIVEKQFDDGSSATFEYDPLGWLTKGENSSCTATFERDACGNLVKEGIGSYTVESGYSAVGDRIWRRSNLGADERFELDPDGNISRLELGGIETLDFTRDTEGVELERRSRSGLRMQQTFDSAGFLTAQSVSSPRNQAIVRRQYRYSNTGCLVAIDDRRTGSRQYTYDARRQLTQVSLSGTPVERYRFDAAGNLTYAAQPNGVFEYSFASGGRAVARTGTRYEHDATGRTILKISGDGRRWTYEWNAEGLLAAVITPEGHRWTYEYDPFGRRVRKIGVAGTIEYVWDDFVPVHERTTSGVTTWLYEPMTYRPIAKLSGERVFNCVNDQIGVPRELVSSTGDVAWSAAQTVWGEPVNSNQDSECPIRFQGQWFDSESGLCYNRFRYYDPERSTFISPDPAGLNGSLRLYEYPRDPLGYIDPSGLVPLNDPGHLVYGIFEKGPDGNPTGDPIYVGITNDENRRSAQHSEPGGRLTDDRVLVPLPGESDLKYKEARGREQAYIEHFETKPADKKGSPPGNVINSFDHDRKDKRGKAFEKEYKKKKAELDAQKACPI